MPPTASIDKNSARNSIVDNVKALPTIPHVIQRLIPLMQDENVSIDDILSVIEFDVGISTRLLKVANSAYYGFMSRIATVRHAITVLGLREVKSLVMGISVLDVMKELGSRAGLDYKLLWMHSVGTAMATGILSRYVSGVSADAAFTAALLHDIGKLPLNALFEREYGRVLEAAGRGESIYAAEERVFGFEHGEVGGWLCSMWKLPDELAIPITYHHRTERAGSDRQLLISVVCCANEICKSVGIGCSGRDGSGSDLTRIPGELPVSHDDLQSICNEFAGEKGKAGCFFDIMQQDG